MEPPNPTPKQRPRYDVRGLIAMWFAFVIGFLLIAAPLVALIRGEPLPEDRAAMVYDLAKIITGALLIYLGDRRRRNGETGT